MSCWPHSREAIGSEVMLATFAGSAGRQVVRDEACGDAGKHAKALFLHRGRLRCG